jgi:hypothetical protein
MRKLILVTSLGLSAASALVQAEPIKVPVDSDDKGTVYVAPNVNPTEQAATGGVSSDGKANNGVKAGVTIKY